MKDKRTCFNCPSKENSFLAELDDSQLAEINKSRKTSVVKKGQTIYLQDSHSYAVHHLCKGKVKKTIQSADGKEAIVQIISPGEVFGSRGALTGQDNSTTATAIEDCVICSFDKNIILNLVKTIPSVAFRFIQFFGVALGESQQKVATFTQKNVLERTCETLWKLAINFGEAVVDKTELKINLKRSELASFVGTSTEGLVRTLTELKEEKIISLSGKHIFIKDMEKLSELAKI